LLKLCWSCVGGILKERSFSWVFGPAHFVPLYLGTGRC
jgi:hypothetical protein